MKSYSRFDKPYIYAAFPEGDARSLAAMESLSESVTFHYAGDFKKSERKFLEGAWAVLLFADRAFAKSELFLTLAREELIENGNWVSYCLENKPDFSL